MSVPSVMSKAFCCFGLRWILTHLKSWTEHSVNRFFSADAIEGFCVALWIIGGVKLHKSCEIFPSNKVFRKPVAGKIVSASPERVGCHPCGNRLDRAETLQNFERNPGKAPGFSFIRPYGSSRQNCQGDVVCNALSQSVTSVFPGKEVRQFMNIGRIIAAQRASINPRI
jgi:hypothetical protein